MQFSRTYSSQSCFSLWSAWNWNLWQSGCKPNCAHKEM